VIGAIGGSYIAVDTGVQATSSTSGGGTTVIAYYQIHVGNAFSYVGNGWGAGPWPGNAAGSFNHPWNTGFTGGGIVENLRLWSANNFGQDLIINPRGGGIYYWSAGECLTAGGQIIGTADYPEGRAIPLNSPAVANISAGALANGGTYEITAVGTSNFTLVGAATNTVGTIFTATGPTTGTGTVVDVNIPTVANFVFVSSERYVFALGCNDPFTTNPTQQDPMFISWSDQGNPAVWTPLVTNTAGNYRLSYGSQIVTAVKTIQEVLIWTDSAIYSMRYQGSPFIYGFFPLATDITIVSQNAAATANQITYWMGNDKFYVYNGAVNTLPCTLRQYVFSDINTTEWGQVYASTNEKYNEIWWFYCSSTATLNDRYVVYNHLENIWYYGQLSRTAWLDSHIVGNPFGASNGLILEHESGADDGSTNPPSPITAYIATGEFDIGEGGYQFSYINRLIPDVDFIGSTTPTPSVNMRLTAQNFPGVGINDDPMQFSQSTVAANQQTLEVYDYSKQFWIRIRGRQIAFGVGSNSLGVRWQLGTPRIQLKPDGRR
jgi:hypothetical protein